MKRAATIEMLPAEMLSGTYFREPVRAWFDPIYAAQGLKRWEPIIQTEKRSSSEASRASSEARERLIEQGVASAPDWPDHPAPAGSLHRRRGQGLRLPWSLCRQDGLQPSPAWPGATSKARRAARHRLQAPKLLLQGCSRR
jgi:hypothetical protein